MAHIFNFQSLSNIKLLSHPASGWFKYKMEKRKRKTEVTGRNAYSPDSFQSRGNVQKQNSSRFNPAP